MSVYIRGMEMPKPKSTTMATIYGAYILVSPNGHTVIVVENEDELDTTKYPLIPIPSCGRLIDADALCETLRKLPDNEYTPTVFANWIEHHIDSIIPAESLEEE